jgi:hypothetical protein
MDIEESDTPQAGGSAPHWLRVISNRLSATLTSIASGLLPARHWRCRRYVYQAGFEHQPATGYQFVAVVELRSERGPSRR